MRPERAAVEKVGDNSEEENEDDALIVESYPKTDKNDSAPVTTDMGITNNMATCVGSNMNKKAVHEIRGQSDIFAVAQQQRVARHIGSKSIKRILR